MWEQLLSLIGLVLPAFKRNATTGEAEIVLPILATHQVAVIPSWLAGKYVEVTAVGASCDLLCSDAQTEITYGTESTIDGGTKAITTSALSARRYVDGVTRTFVVPLASRATFFCWEGSGTGKLYIGASSEPLKR